MLFLMLMGCDESLPPRLPDPNPFSVNAAITPGRVVVRGDFVGGTAGDINVSVTNVYTEVLQDTAAVAIRCRIWLADYPDSAGVVTIDASSLTDQSLMRGEVLTLLPQATALFNKRWNYTTAGGTPFWNMLQLRSVSSFMGPYMLSDSVKVLMTDTVRLFKPVPAYILGPVLCMLQFEIHPVTQGSSARAETVRVPGD
jgi:hypothetical protein